MKISKSSLNNSSWMAELGKTSSVKKIEPLTSSVCISKNVTSQTIHNVCSHIEEIAEDPSCSFCINGTWDDDVKSYLREYAIACGLDRSRIVEASKEQIELTLQNIKESKREKEALSKYASKEVQEVQEESNELADSLSNVMSDPFKIDEKLADDRNIHEDWEQISYAKNLKDKPSTKGINAIRGGENYNESPEYKGASNQNSILEPNKIEDLFNSETMDVGERIRQEKGEILKERMDAQQKDRDASLTEASEQLSIMTIGNVFPTESLTAQTGIKGRMGGSLMDFESIPEKTEGEMFKEMQQEKTSSIQREKKSDRSWEKVDNNVRSISEDFVKDLERLMGKK